MKNFRSFIHSRAQKGFTLALVVVYGAVFLTVSLALVGYLLELQRAQQQRIGKEGAFDIAEAGLDYYAWHLAHFPNDLQDGTGAAGPYVHTYQDPEGGTAGTFSLSVNGSMQCGSVNAIDITSTGVTTVDPSHKATVTGRYAHESVANYSYVLNSAVWAGSTRTISGRYHSNNGIRMDGANLSTVESSVANWTCTPAYGCNPNKTVNGVFGTGAGSALWSFPVPQIDFGSISVKLATLKDAAKNSGGIYLAPLSGSQTQRGYHLIFNGDGTVTIKKVSGTIAAYGSPDGSTFAQEHTIIDPTKETTVSTRVIPLDCGVIFAEDRVWIEGTIKGKVTVAAADLTGSGYNPDAILRGNLTYADYDGSDGLTVVAAGNVLIPLDSPDTMELHGIFIAQNGYYGRNYYCYNCSNAVPPAYKNNILRSSLKTVGTIVSNGRTGTAWVNGLGATISGYQARTDSYDGSLASDPPPFTPYASSDYEFVRWRQK